MNAVQMVDAFCDYMQERVENPRFQVKHYRAFCRSQLKQPMTDEKASQHLQLHRQAQKRDEPPRHVIACQGYGIAAQWQMVDHKNAIDQDEWVLNDAGRRLVSDTMTEVYPALRGHPQEKNVVQFVAASVESAIKNAVSLIRGTGWNG